MFRELDNCVVSKEQMSLVVVERADLFLRVSMPLLLSVSLSGLEASYVVD